MTAGAHWAFKYLGIPWVALENDCWSFLRRVQLEQFGREVPIIDVDATDVLACVRAFNGHGERGNWLEISPPAEGDAVLMSQSRVATHVGVWVDVDGGGIIHCIQGGGVIFTRPSALRSIGYSMLSTYRYTGAAC